MSLRLLARKLKGGPGSGHRGHSGRPGKRGGSLGAKGGSASASYERFDEDLAAGDKKLNDYYNLKKNITKAQHNSLVTYTADDSVNERLRHGIAGMVKKTQREIGNLDAAMEKAPRTPQNMKVFRGIDSNIADKFSVGSVFTDKGYTSTSTEKEFAQLWKDVTVEIRIPKGSKGIFIGGISPAPNEHELLLPRGSKMKVLSKTSDNIVVELI